LFVKHLSGHVGVDFGTSNTAAAICRAPKLGGVHIADVDVNAQDPTLLRSVLFFADGTPDVSVGADAIANYVADEEGRFIQSVKSFLPSTTFKQTVIRQRRWLLAELIAEVLRPIRVRLEATLDGPVQTLVLGRPAVFSTDAAVDAQAQATLRQAAIIAGFPDPTFVIEPIAAALRYEEQLDHDELVLVGDFGAGTSDFTLMRLGPSRTAVKDRSEDILASGGVYIGGDTFDAAIVEHALLPKFGQGSTYMDFAQRTDLPAWIVGKMTRWHELSLLRDPKLMQFLQRALVTSSDPKGLGAFLALLEENLGFALFRAVEATKRALSTQERAPLCFDAGGIELNLTIRRDAFETWTAPLIARLDKAVDDVLKQHEIRSPDAVFLTGGSSKIPCVQRLFRDRFGADKLRSGDAFTSVAAGLGRAAALV
jgi:hypothetical chaperone protein